MRLISIVAILLLGCVPKAERESASTNSGYQVETVFEHEGCKVYRFNDNWRTVYYTNCRGETTWREGCGKNCTRDVSVTTGK